MTNLTAFFKDKRGHLAIFQRPNVYILVWFGCAVARRLLGAGQPKDIVGVIGFVALVVWSLLEIVQGASLFRRLLGAVVLALSLYGRLV